MSLDLCGPTYHDKSAVQQGCDDRKRGRPAHRGGFFFSARPQQKKKRIKTTIRTSMLRTGAVRSQRKIRDAELG